MTTEHFTITIPLAIRYFSPRGRKDAVRRALNSIPYGVWITGVSTTTDKNGVTEIEDFQYRFNKGEIAKKTTKKITKKSALKLPWKDEPIPTEDVVRR